MSATYRHREGSLNVRVRGAVLENVGGPQPYAEHKPITICELELEEPGETELLVRIDAAGVCHSDLSVVNGDRVRPTPMLLGHEASGIVESVGERVFDIVPGDRVVMTFLPRCEACDNCEQDGRLPCLEGTKSNNAGVLLGGSRRLSRGGQPVHHHLGVSGFADHAVVGRESVVRVGGDVPPAVAATLGCAVLTGGGAYINAVRPGPGESLMIVGLGGVGMAALLTAIAEECAEIIAVDHSQEKLVMARDLGIAETYTPEEVDERGVSADHSLECAGNARAFETAFNATRVGGRTVTVGLPAPDAVSSINPLKLTAEARTVIGSYLGSSVPSRDIPHYEDLWRRGKLPIEKLITSSITLAEINQAMDDLSDGKAVRQVIRFDSAETPGTENA